MRSALKKIEEQRESFTGVFSKYGLKTNYRGPSTDTVLLTQIRDPNGAFICDHLWFNLTKGFENLGTLTPGDRIRFSARVKKYTKGYVNRRAGIDQSEFDYKLSHPTKIEKIASIHP
ncbi:MAG TPA: hypothetical protein VNS58_19040 [Puia sp.]|nr:hypothetical protein [Puia sp.]